MTSTHMVKTALDDATAGHNVYIEARTVRNDLSGNKRGELEDTVWVFGLVVDTDADKGKGGNVTAKPSLAVETSPGNFHLWYLFDRAIPAAQAKHDRRGHPQERRRRPGHRRRHPVLPRGRHPELPVGQQTQTWPRTTSSRPGSSNILAACGSQTNCWQHFRWRHRHTRKASQTNNGARK